jgi:hypothetical protein
MVEDCDTLHPTSTNMGSNMETTWFSHEVAEWVMKSHFIDKIVIDRFIRETRNNRAYVDGYVPASVIMYYMQMTSYECQYVLDFEDGLF